MTGNRTTALFGLIVLLAVTLWTFIDCLHNPFHFDDALFLRSPQVTEPGDPWQLLKPSQPRPLTYLTFYWNYRLGAAAPAGYHLVNLLLHLGNVVALYLCVGLLLRRKPDAFDPATRRWLALSAAAVFALHPVQSEAVNYIYQRSTLLAATFMLLSMIGYLRSELGVHSGMWRIVSGLCFFLAVCSKEVALILPLLCMGLIWAEAGNGRAFVRSVFRSPWLVALIIASSSGVGWILFNMRRRGEITTGFEFVADSARYLLVQIQVIAAYLRLLIVPTGLSIDHDFRPAPVFSISSLLCMVLLAGIVISAILLRRRNPMAAFLIVSFLILLVPTSSIVPSRDLLFEHRLYLPMTAASILIAWAVLLVIRQLIVNEGRRIAVSILCWSLLAGCYSVLSKRRTYIWGTAIRLWEDAVAKAPLKPRPHYNLGVANLENDRSKARQEFLKTVELDPRHAAALYNLGWLAQSDRAYDTARSYYGRALEADPRTWQAHQNLGNLDVAQQDLAAAEQEFRQTISLRKDYWPAYLSLATLQLQTGDTRAALETLNHLERLRGDLLEARYLSAWGLAAEGRFTEAENELRFIALHDTGGVYRSRVESLRRQFSIPGANQ